jgi:hypothetical protein
LLHFQRDTRFPAKPLAGLVGDEETILTDEPWMSVARGRRPVVLDAVSLARMVRAEPRNAEVLVRRIHAREFTKVVLASLPAEPGELDTFYFGRPIAEAIRVNYRLQATSGGYAVFVPIGKVASEGRPVDSLAESALGRFGDGRSLVK